MLPSSVRRVISTAPPSPIISCLATCVPRSASSYAACYKPNSHQRRYSSSKPSSPDNGPKDLPAGQSVPASSQPAESKSSGEKRKRRVKSSSASAKKLPSVPSTQHLSQEALALSTFFSLHRPISVTHTIPKTVSEDAFASIFTPKTRSQKASDVISTLSATVQELEQPMARLGISGSQDSEGGNEPVAKVDVKHADGSESSVYVNVNAMSGQFLPFTPPPLPQPENARAEAEARGEEAAEQAPQHRVYKAIFTIEETTEADGQVRVLAHSPQLIEEQSIPRTFLERMALRQLKYEEGRPQGENMLAISVRRQKKLKMKKKKYKKLMRRTRNIRRKLDRN